MPVLSGRALTKRYKDRVAIDQLSLSVDAGEIVAVVGPNGAGKTTLLAILAGCLTPSSGEIVQAAAPLGWVPQHPAIYGRLTVRENLMLFARLERIGDAKSAVARTLRDIGLVDRADDRADTLSGGMRQRLNLGVGLIADPSVLLLDEPFASLDAVHVKRLWSLITELAGRGIAIVLTTHSIADVARHAGRTFVIVEGRSVFIGSTRELGQSAEAVESKLIELFGSSG